MVMNDIDVNSCKIYNLSWSEFSASLTTVVQNLRRKEDLIDVTISAGGKHFPAHKLVLGAASPLLMDLLKNTTCQHPILMLAGISASDLETILNFVYNGEISIDSEKLPSLLQAAQFLDIRALSPAALVLNSLQSPSSLFTRTADESVNSAGNSGSINEKEDNQDGKMDICETEITSQKRKRVVGPLEDVLCQQTRAELNLKKKNVAKILKETPITEDDKISHIVQKVQPQSHINEPLLGHTEGILLATEDKKIISDLPVNCKICGVIIRQSRNLRRHMDQMHLKVKVHKNKDQKRKRPFNNKDMNRNIIKKINTSNTSTFLDFSDDSFNQLTDEIFNYSSIPDAISNANAFSSSAASADSCIIDDSQSTNISTTTSSTLLCAVPQSLNALLNDLCFHLPTTTTMTMTTSNASISEKKSTSIDGRTSNENLEYGNLEDEDDCCNTEDNSNDILTYKELDNQLLSACFCSSENEV